MLELRQLGRYRVTAMLTTLPYISFQSYCAKQTYTLIVLFYMLMALKSLNETQQTASMHQNNLSQLYCS